jgi:hypothetical protein
MPKFRARSGWVSLFLTMSCLLSLAACAATSTDLRPTPIPTDPHLSRDGDICRLAIRDERRWD